MKEWRKIEPKSRQEQEWQIRKISKGTKGGREQDEMGRGDHKKRGVRKSKREGKKTVKRPNGEQNERQSANLGETPAN